MELTANRQVNLPPTTQLQSQTSGNSEQSSGKPFDPELLKDEKAALGVARELAEAAGDSSIRTTQAGVNNDKTATALQPVDSAEWSRQEGAPNWSNLSAQSKGYTFNERAINLYRHINAMAV